MSSVEDYIPDLFKILIEKIQIETPERIIDLVQFIKKIIQFLIDKVNEDVEKDKHGKVIEESIHKKQRFKEMLNSKWLY